MQEGKEEYRQRLKSREKSGNFFQSGKRDSEPCRKCGTINPYGSFFCEECGAPLGEETCPRCGAVIPGGADVCEQCGNYIKTGQCGFCGEDIGEEDLYCPECGGPRGGITCPYCHTHNNSAFCSNCNKPLTEVAFLELQKAAKDPFFHQVVAVSQELGELEKQLTLLQDNVKLGSVKKPALKPGETDRQQKREHRNEELKQIYLKLAAAGNTSSDKKGSSPEPDVCPLPDDKNQRMEETKGNAPEIMASPEIERIILEKRKQLQQLLDSMKPENCTGPQMVRNYYMARKPPESDVVWECNFNHRYHPNPTHCGKPFLGGRWVLESRKIKWHSHHGEH